MVCVRRLTLAGFLMLLGCSDSPESATDDIAEKSKELVQSARDMSEDAAERMTEEIGSVKEKASEKLHESVKALRE